MCMLINGIESTEIQFSSAVPESPSGKHAVAFHIPSKSLRALSLKEAAGCLNASEKTVRRWIGRGLMRRCGVTRKILIPIEDVEKFFEKHSQVEWHA